MHPQVFISGLILLLPAAAESFPEVHGVVGHPVTLPCTYPVSNGLSPTCWGRLACFTDKCKNVVILTNGYYVYYERNNRYHLKGQLLRGNVSLTIENVTESDSGLYCCRVEMAGWNGVRRLTISLQVQPGTDPTQNPPRIMTKGFYIGISIALVLLLLVSTMVITKCVFVKKEPGSLRDILPGSYCSPWRLEFLEPLLLPYLPGMCQLSDFPICGSELVPKELLSSDNLFLVAFRVCKIRTLQNSKNVRPRVQENIYIIEDSPPVKD